jgi:hypothetical protein
LTGSTPQLVSLVAVAIGAVLFVVSLRSINLADTIDDVLRLGIYVPADPHAGMRVALLRTWGGGSRSPNTGRPPFTRLFRVRLAADAISFFTIRGLTVNHSRSFALRPDSSGRHGGRDCRRANGIRRDGDGRLRMVSYVAVRRLAMPGGWDALFTLVSIGAVVLMGVLAQVARHRTGDYLGRFVHRHREVTGRQLESSRVIRFILDVEDIVLGLLRGDRRRLIILTVLPIVCYGLMAFEVWLVLWSVGQPIGVMPSLAIETFARLGSVASAFIPANIGALEASNAAPVAMLGLAAAARSHSPAACGRCYGRRSGWCSTLASTPKSQLPTPNLSQLPTPNSQHPTKVPITNSQQPRRVKRSPAVTLSCRPPTCESRCENSNQFIALVDNGVVLCGEKYRCFAACAFEFEPLSTRGAQSCAWLACRALR